MPKIQINGLLSERSCGFVRGVSTDARSISAVTHGPQAVRAVQKRQQFREKAGTASCLGGPFPVNNNQIPEFVHSHGRFLDLLRKLGRAGVGTRQEPPKGRSLATDSFQETCLERFPSWPAYLA